MAIGPSLQSVLLLAGTLFQLAMGTFLGAVFLRMACKFLRGKSREISSQTKIPKSEFNQNPIPNDPDAPFAPPVISTRPRPPAHIGYPSPSFPHALVVMFIASLIEVVGGICYGVSMGVLLGDRVARGRAISADELVLLIVASVVYVVISFVMTTLVIKFVLPAPLFNSIKINFIVWVLSLLVVVAIAGTIGVFLLFG